MTTRRDFLRTGAAVGAAVVANRLPSAQAESKREFRFEYVLGSSMYGKLKLAEILPEVAKTGTKFLDVWPLSHGDQREQIEAMGHEKFADMLRQHDVRLGMITQYKLGPLHLKDELRVLKKFGGRLMISGSTGPKNVEGEEAKAGVAKFLERMKPQIAVAEELDVVIGIENHANALVASPDSIRYFADLNRSKHIGIALAPYHLPQDPHVLAALIEHLGPALVHFYAWEHGQGANQTDAQLALLQMPGIGSLDFRPIVAALQKINYTRWTEIFMHPTPRGIPILPQAADCTAAINRSRKYLDQCARDIA